MSVSLKLVLLIAAFVCFVIAAWKGDGRVTAAGLACWVGSLIF